MNRPAVIGRKRGNRGQNLVEFAACTVLALMLLFAVVEFGRMVLAYTTICNAARIGVRFASAHGSDNLASTATIQSVVNNYLSAAAIDTGSVTVTTTYPGNTGCASGSTFPGCKVEITVSYPYQTMLTYFPINVTLSSQTEGVITY